MIYDDGMKKAIVISTAFLTNSSMTDVINEMSVTATNISVTSIYGNEKFGHMLTGIVHNSKGLVVDTTTEFDIFRMLDF